MRIVTLLVGVLGFAALGSAALAATPGAVSPAATDPAATELTLVDWDPQITDFDRVMGSPDAPVTIVEYASLSCPHCADFSQETLPQLKAQYIDTGKARLVFRDFPLNRPALQAAQLAHCVPEDNFFPIVDMLFKSQEKWLTDDAGPALVQLVAFAGLPPEAAQACLANEELGRRIAQVRVDAEQQYQINSTPTFFINGKRIEGAQPFTVFAQAIDDALAGS